MAIEREGRVLDVAVARALGFTAFRSDDGLWELRRMTSQRESRPLFRTKAEAWGSCLHYSTDPALLAPMLEWAKAQGWSVSLEAVPAPYHWKAEIIVPNVDGKGSTMVFGYAGNPLAPDDGGPQRAVAYALAAIGGEDE